MAIKHGIKQQQKGFLGKTFISCPQYYITLIIMAIKNGIRQQQGFLGKMIILNLITTEKTV